MDELRQLASTDRPYDSRTSSEDAIISKFQEQRGRFLGITTQHYEAQYDIAQRRIAENQRRIAEQDQQIAEQVQQIAHLIEVATNDIVGIACKYSNSEKFVTKIRKVIKYLNINQYDALIYELEQRQATQNSIMAEAIGQAIDIIRKSLA
jgi:microsomal dipeptidase-like Zn-dependent dipeptidase